VAVTVAPSIVACRHNHGGRHYDALQAGAQNPKQHAMFCYERYSRPCISMGTFDESKNPGLVVADLCAKAAEFLRSIGKGNLSQKAEADRDYDFGPERPLPSSRAILSSSQAPEEPGSILDVDILLATKDAPDPEKDECDDASFREEDISTELPSTDREIEGETAAPDSIGSLTGVNTSEDSIMQSPTRLSTKMRAATLGYLWQFADDPQELKAQFKRLRGSPELHVLHLCGCGVSYTVPGTRQRISGCVERSHLMLGTAADNRHHKT